MVRNTVAAIRIDILDMYLRDQRALDLLKANADPHTHRVQLTREQLGNLLSCHPNTIGRITDRLAGAGYIRKHGNRRTFSIEVLCLPSKPISSI